MTLEALSFPIGLYTWDVDLMCWHGKAVCWVEILNQRQVWNQWWLKKKRFKVWMLFRGRIRIQKWILRRSWMGSKQSHSSLHKCFHGCWRFSKITGRALLSLPLKKKQFEKNNPSKTTTESVIIAESWKNLHNLSWTTLSPWGLLGKHGAPASCDEWDSRQCKVPCSHYKTGNSSIFDGGG